MTVAQLIAPNIPYLRRYARALTGNQNAGDAYVGAALDALVAQPDLYNNDLPPRVALYRLFSRVWQLFATSMDRENGFHHYGPDVTLDALAPLSRQAFLLVSMEGFTTEEAAEILTIAPEAIIAAQDEAGRDLAHAVATTVLIIEDNPLIVMDLETLVENLGHHVLGKARTHKEAIQLANEIKPGLVLADIQLADGSSGVDAVNDILNDLDVPVIFITAYPERLLTGSRPEPVFLITKPFQPQTVRAVVSQALFFRTLAQPATDAQTVRTGT